jgi:hypothetical protein
MSVASTGGSGNVGPDELRSLTFGSSLNGQAMMSATFVVQNLSPGTHTFTAKYRTAGAGAQADFFTRSIIVIPLP